MKLFQGGKIATEGSPELLEVDVLVGDDGVISEVGPGLKCDNAEVMDCSGKILVPGMFDMHVHARDLSACAELARNGGITGMAMMPDLSSVVDDGNLARLALEATGEIDGITILQIGAISKNLEGKELAAIAGMAHAGVPMLSDSPHSVPDTVLMKRAMEYAMEFDLPLAVRGDVPELSKNGAMNEGSASYRLGLPGMPSISEEIGIERNIRIAQYTGGHVHIQQVSTAVGLKSIERAKADGVNVTCEVSPHHLIFNEDDIGHYDTRFKVNPPLRLAEDNAALIEGLKNGVIDVIATDHSTRTKYEIATDFGSAPFGVSGLETAVVSMYHELIREDVLGWDVLVNRFSNEPRRLLNLDTATIEEGSRADFFIFDPEGETRISEERVDANTPWMGRSLTGLVEKVVRF